MATLAEMQALAALQRLAPAVERLAVAVERTAPPEPAAPPQFSTLELSIMKTCIDKEYVHVEEESMLTADAEERDRLRGRLEDIEQIVSKLDRLGAR